MRELEASGVLVVVVSIGREEGSLQHAQHVGRTDVLHLILAAPTVVEHVVAGLVVGDIEACGHLLKHFDIGVEAEVQSAEVVALERGIALGVAEREVVHTDVVTTFDADLVVLRECRAVEIFLPVGVVVEDAAVVVAALRSFVEEGILAEVAVGRLADVLDRSCQLAEVVAIGRTVHHLEAVGSELHASVHANINLCGHAVAALGVDDDDAVGALCAVECRTVLYHLNALNVLGVETSKDVVEESFVEAGALFLQIDHITVDDEERLSCSVQ